MRSRNRFLATLALGWVATLPSAAAPKSIELDPARSRLTFSFDSTLHEVHGTLHLAAGRIAFDPDGGTVSGEIVVDATRTETGNDGRDKKMHASVLESHLFPTFVFRPQRIVGEVRPAGSSEVEVAGQIEIHGESHPLTMPATVLIEGDDVSVTTGFPIPYVEWGMKNPSMFVLRVAKSVDVTIAARGRLVQDTALSDPPPAP
jgi:polyisoprenoid-binding protein YceI